MSNKNLFSSLSSLYEQPYTQIAGGNLGSNSLFPTLPTYTPPPVGGGGGPMTEPTKKPVDPYEAIGQAILGLFNSQTQGQNKTPGLDLSGLLKQIHANRDPVGAAIQQQQADRTNRWTAWENLHFGPR